MFYKVGFFVLLVIVILGAWVFMKANPMKNQGAASWTEFYSSSPVETTKFLETVFGIKSEKYIDPSHTDGMEYFSLKAKGQFWPFAGVIDPAQLPMPDGMTIPPHTMVYLTVKDYASAHQKMLDAGATAMLADQVAAGMRFGVYMIPGGLTIGIAQYGVKK